MLVHTALIENHLFCDSLMKRPNYSIDYYHKLCKKKDFATNKHLIEAQFMRIAEFDEKIRRITIANAYPSIFKSPFKPCNYQVYF